MTIRYRSLRGYKYELAETYSVATDLKPLGALSIQIEYLALTVSGFLTIARGYAWDGPSGPAIDTRNFMRASLVHDALYQLIRLGLLPRAARAAADALLHRMLLEDGMSRIRAAWVYASVRAMGWTATRPESRAFELLEAP